MTSPTPSGQRPVSLGDHQVPDERLALIAPHIAMLAETARAVGDRLPLEADATDMVAVLEGEVE